MNNEEIKRECEICYAGIKMAQTRLEELREMCKHENTYEGIWSYRIGSMQPATICSDCGYCIQVHQTTIVFE